MSSFQLQSPEEALAAIAQVLAAGNGEARLEVHEDICFQKDCWLNLGKIKVHPAGIEQDVGESPIEQAVRYGSYSWSVPAYEAIVDQVEKTFEPGKARTKPDQIATHEDKKRRGLEAIMHCATRCGFMHPSFDARSVTEMPFDCPTTVVVDTSAVMQGGLDFIVRFLYPMVRIKIPAIVHMEILTMADRYFNRRRAPTAEGRSAGTLLDHIQSQGSQRALLRLELQTNVEIERPRLGADPLRGVVQPDTDAEDKALNLQNIQRSFADRLILETAIQHRDRLSPDHPIMVLTADQGLARMTLGEGLHPLFFSLPALATICGRTLSGTGFRPFMDPVNDNSLYHIPLQSLIWELACTFGSARLSNATNDSSLTVSAIGSDLTWHPFHSHDDLLWTLRVGKPVPTSPPVPPIPAGAGPEKDEEPSGRKSSGAQPGSYRFPVKSMIALALAFEHKDRISDREGARLVGLKVPKRYQDFKNFFVACGFVKRDRTVMQKLSLMDDFIDSIKTVNVDRLKELVSRAPSVASFQGELKVGAAIAPEEIKCVGRFAVPTYVSLCEICCAALVIPDEGIYLTPNSPRPSEFTAMALDVYRSLKGAENYILTGKWLEELARRYGVHPIKSRQRLNESRELGLIERYTEGSTPETQYERHKMIILEVVKGQPSLRKLNLFHGNFLIPEKQSVSIRLEEKPNGPAR